MKVKPVIHPFRKPNCQLLPGRRRKLDSSTPYPVLVYALAGVYGGAATTDDANDHRRCHYPLDEARMHCVSTAIRHCEFQILKAKKKKRKRESREFNICINYYYFSSIFSSNNAQKLYECLFHLIRGEDTPYKYHSISFSLSLSLSFSLCCCC